MQMHSKNVHIIINPVAGGGQAGRLQSWLQSEITDRFGRDYTLFVTQKPGEATTFAREAINIGARLIIVVGGDGTVQEAINGFFENRKPKNPSCELGIVNCGTGSGLAQTLGLPSSPEQQLDVIHQQPSKAVDAGLVTFHDCEGKEGERFFINECQVGIGGSVVADVKSLHKYFGGTVAFGSVTIMKILTFKAPKLTVQLGKNMLRADRLIGIVVGNGVYCGGGMKLTPSAKPDDGQFDVLLIHDMSLPTRLWNFPKIYTGNHVYSPHFTLCRCKKIAVDSEESVLVEADGELLGKLPCAVEMFHAALRIRCNL
jgi:YegS/Rv2252/BmrU family lipid kinase